MPPKLSIIIITWNTADVTLKCVKTVKKYLYSVNTQIIVVDNASTDNTVNLLKKENITIIKNKQNLGFSKAANIGANYANGEYLLFLNSDIELIDDSVVKMLNFISNNSGIGLIGPQFLNPDLSIQASVFPPQTITNAIKQYFYGQQCFFKYTPKTKKPISVEAISGGAMMVKHDFFNKICGWNEKYFMYYEDLDLCQRTHQQNMQVFYFPQAKIIHRHGISGAKLADSKNQWRRLIPSSKIYHGIVKHYIIFLILWIGQKYKKLRY